MDKEDEKRHNNKMSSAQMFGIFLVIILLYAVFAYFLVIPVYQHASKTGNGWAVFWAGFPFPFNWIAKWFFALNPAFQK
jgi:hypothetical protein